MPVITLIASDEASGQRVDRWLASQLAEHSRSEIQRWIDEKRISIHAAALKAGYRLTAGETVVIDAPDAAKPTTLEAQDIPLAILYEDNDLLIINKPAGLVVHPAPGHADGTVVNAVLHHDPDLEGVGGEQRPGRCIDSTRTLRGYWSLPKMIRRIASFRRNSRSARSTKSIWHWSKAG